MSFDDTQDKKILAIETSCDETAVAIVEARGGVKSPSFRILSNVVASQAKLHATFGGVVPNLAKREHQKNLMPVLLQALATARMLNSRVRSQKSKLQLKIQNLLSPQIDATAVTIGPGLAPALWTGVNFAKELAQKWKKPLIPVNHMDGHIASVLLDTSQKIIFPALALLVSGGHTELVLMKNWRNKKIIGETLDDAAGEAFDKVARLLGFSYPGGSAIAKEAEKNFQFPISNFQTNSKYQISNSQIKLPRPMLHTKDYNFSFSGLKTAVLYLIEKLKKQGVSIKKMRPFIAKEFQDAAVDVLVAKTIRAAKEYGVKTIILGGGVAANQLLRETLGKEIQQKLPVTRYALPAPQFTGDNAAMIAAAAYLSPRKISWTKLKAIDRLRI